MVSKLSQIATAGIAPALTDTVVGVALGTTDLRYTVAQIANAISNDVRASKTADYVIVTSDLPMQFDNAGATQTVQFTLPAIGTPGLVVGFYVAVPQQIIISTLNGVKIEAPGLVSGAPPFTNETLGGTLSSSTVGSYIILEAVSTTLWAMKQSPAGAWDLGPYNIIPSTTRKMFLLSDGDSITQNTPPSWTPYPNLYVPTSNTTTKLVNVGHAGDQLSGPQSRLASNIAQVAANPGYNIYVYTLLIGANEASNPTYFPSNASGYVTDISTLLDALKAGGYTYVIPITMPYAPGASASADTWRQQVNTGLRALYPTHADAIVDFEFSEIGSWGIFSGHENRALTYDGVHLTQLGHDFAERTYATVVNSLIEGAVTPGQPSNVVAVWAKDTSVLLTWTPPTSGGYFTDYIIEWSLSGNNSWTTFTHTASKIPGILVTGLSALTMYDFRVGATGSLGTSAKTVLTGVQTISSLPDTLDPFTSAATGFVAHASRPTDLTNIFFGLTFPPPLLFSNNNKTVSTNRVSIYRTPGNNVILNIAGIARTFIGQSAPSPGQWYFEFLVESVGGGPIRIGICDGTFPILMQSLYSIGTFTNSADAMSSNVVGFTVVNAPGGTPGLGDRLCIAFDTSAKKAWMGINNVWHASGNPVSGTNPWVTWSPTYTIFGVAELDYAGNQVTYSGTTPFYVPPTGYLPL